MKKLFITMFLMVLFFLKTIGIPRPDHVVICILENHKYTQIIGCPLAPYINHLVSQSANLQEYYALTHPSQPNYLQLFSGSNQGVTDDGTPSGIPWTSPNLGSYLINNGFTFRGYSESLPYIGCTTSESGNYVRKHNPWVNWQGSGLNQIPSYCNSRMTDWPTNYDNLPTVSIVVPNQMNDMHSGSVTRGDAWVFYNLKSYVDWCWTHNSLFILTVDEDDFTTTNRVPCLFVGPMIRKMSSNIGYNHYDLLRTIEDMYGLYHAGQSANGHTINDIWLTTEINDIVGSKIILPIIYPNPVTADSKIFIDGEKYGKILLSLYSMNGTLISNELIIVLPGNNSYPFKKEDLSAGIYYYSLSDGVSGKFIVK